MTLKTQSDWLKRRKAEFGYSGDDFVMPNSGLRRSAEKRDLLRKLAKLREGNLKALKFIANF
jgi:hypothetical protein